MKVTVSPSRIKIYKKNPDSACSLKLKSGTTDTNEKIEGGYVDKKSKYILLKTDGSSFSTNHVYESIRPAAAAVKAYLGLSKKTKHLWKKYEGSFEESKYMDLIKKELFAPPAVITLRKVDSLKIVRYIVEYKPIYEPNALEIEKGIFKKAVATKINSLPTKLNKFVLPEKIYI